MGDVSPARGPYYWGHLSLIYLCFFLSGVAGLVYQVVWAKYLALHVGSTGMSHLIVLSTFMGGLALGSFLLGRLVDRVKAPVMLFVGLELGIALFAGVLLEPLLELSRWSFVSLARSSGVQASSLWLVVGKVAACVTVLLIPTILMGGTLPAMSRHVVQSLSGVGPQISWLYFVNSLGAVVGCLLAGFYLISAVGLQLSVMTAAVLNVTAALMAVVGARLARESRASALPADTEDREESDAGVSARTFSLVILGCAGLSGAVSMMYEVAWIRLLTLVLGSSTYSFSLMLAAFILGLSIGGALLSLKKTRRGYTVIFGACEIAVGLTILLSIPFYVRLPYWFNQVASSLAREPETFGIYQGAQFLMCALVMLVPTILQGVTFPAATKLLANSVSGLGGRVGLVLAVNTVGTVLGTLFAGLVGLPLLGIQGTLELAILTNCALGAVILMVAAPGHWKSRTMIAAAVACVVVGGWYALSRDVWNREVMLSASYRARERWDSFRQLELSVSHRETVFYRDGLDATVAVQDEPDQFGTDRMLVINGKVDASTSVAGDLLTQKMLSHLPLLTHPNPKRVLIIGLGSGATVGAVLPYKEVEKIDFVEISRDIIDVSPMFESVNGRYWEDPRVTAYCEDAKTFLQLQDEPYDVIISEPTNPWISGVAGVFSTEFYEECSRRLAPGGLFVQWIQTYEMEDHVVYSMIETMTGTFPCYTAWNPLRTDTIFMASHEPYGPNFPRMEERIARETVQRSLTFVDIKDLVPILAMQMADRAKSPGHVPWTGITHSDYHPYLDYQAPRGFFIGRNAAGISFLDDRSRSPARANLWLAALLKERPATAHELRTCAMHAQRYGSLFPGAAQMWSRAWAEQFPEDGDAQRTWMLLAPASQDTMTKAAPGDMLLSFELARIQRLGTALRQQASVLKAPDYTGLQEAIDRVMAAFPSAPEADVLRYWRGVILHDQGEYAAAAAELAASAESLRSRRSVTQMQQAGLELVRCHLALDGPTAARDAWIAYVAPGPPSLEVRLLAAQIRAELD
ncbi:hypothetical protein GC173_13675 [bacterium]|nr:hypothetical protein [bacterium]